MYLFDYVPVISEEGIGKPIENVIFLHGFLASSSLWTESVFQNLSESAEANYRLFAIDLLGFGKSPKPRDCLYTIRDHVSMIHKSVISPYQLNSFHVVAHSMGCIIALALVSKYHASVKSITLIAPVSKVVFVYSNATLINYLQLLGHVFFLDLFLQCSHASLR